MNTHATMQRMDEQQYLHGEYSAGQSTAWITSRTDGSMEEGMHPAYRVEQQQRAHHYYYQRKGQRWTNSREEEHQQDGAQHGAQRMEERMEEHQQMISASKEALQQQDDTPHEGRDGGCYDRGHTTVSALHTTTTTPSYAGRDRRTASRKDGGMDGWQDGGEDAATRSAGWKGGNQLIVCHYAQERTEHTIVQHYVTKSIADMIMHSEPRPRKHHARNERVMMQPNPGITL